MSESAAIIGIGETRVGKHPGRSALELQAEAVRLAVTDAGLAKSQIDAVYALGSYIRPRMQHAGGLSEYLGLSPQINATIDIGGTPTFVGMARDAIAAIDAGIIETAVCVYGDNALSRRAPGSHGFTPQVEYGTEEFEDPFGQTVLVSYALLAQRYLDLYKVEPEKTFAHVSLTQRAHAQLNENAAHRKPITIDDYRVSDIVSTPFRKLDCSPVADGAGAFVIASKAKTRQVNNKHIPVSVLGTGLQMTHKIVSQAPDLPALGMAAAGARAFKTAGLSTKDVDLITIHDGFTVSVLLTLELLGFCGPGEAGKFAAEGGLTLKGDLPTNTHGGLLSQGHVGGMLHVLEAVRQLRGDAQARQVANAEIAMTAGVGGAFANCGAMLLGKGF